MEDMGIDPSRAHLEQFLNSLTDFKTPVAAISELPKHDKVGARASWTEAEMESELLYAVQLYLTYLGCPLEYTIPCARAVVNDVLDSSFRLQDFEATPPLLADMEGNGEDWQAPVSANGHGNDAAGGELPDATAGRFGGDAVEPKANVLSAKNLHSYAVAKANELLARWKNDIPNIEPIRLPHGISVHAIKNKRPGMEDRHVIIPDLRAVVDVKGIKSPVSFYAVYDGHAGSVAATYAAAHLHRRLCASRGFPEHMEDALQEAFLSTDNLYTVKGERDKDYSGTTAVVTVVYEKKLYIAWVGDSEAAIVVNGRADKLVEPRHTADNEAERNRVQKEGGTVIVNQGGWRVAAVLTVTRAIGDSGFKPFVTATPDIRVITLDGTEDYLILACDGLWDEISPELAMKETNAFLLKHPDRVDDVAKELADKAKKSGSMDNITVIVVLLKPLTQLLEELHTRCFDNLMDTTTDTPDKSASFANSSTSHDDFADLADSTEFPVEFDPTAQNPFESQNPFDTTPLDSSVLGDFGASADNSASEIDWDFKAVPLNFNEEESQALNVLDQVIDGAAKTDPASLNASQELINFDTSPHVAPSDVQSSSHHHSGGVMDTNSTPGGSLLDHSATERNVEEAVLPQSAALGNGPEADFNGNHDVAAAATGVQRMDLSSEPNSGSGPLPAAASQSEVPVQAEKSVKATPSVDVKKMTEQPKLKPATPSRLTAPSSSHAAAKTPAPAANKAKTTPDSAGAKKTSPMTTKSAPGTAAPTATTEAKKTPLASARKPALPKPAPVKTPDAADDSKRTPAPPASSGVPKATPRPATTASKASASSSGVAAAASAGRTPTVASRTPPTKTVVSATTKTKDAAPHTPDRHAATAATEEKAKLLPATPRTTPAQKRLVLPTKSSSAGVAGTDKVTSSIEPSASKSDSKSSGPATARAGLPATSEGKKAAPVASARTATPAVKTAARPTTTPTATTKPISEKPTPTAAKPSNGAGHHETPKTKSSAPGEMKTPAVPPPARPKTDLTATKRTPAAPGPGTPRPPAATSTPRPKPAEAATPGKAATTKPLVNGDKPAATPSAAAKRPSALVATPRKGASSAVKSEKPAGGKVNGIPPANPPAVNGSGHEQNGHASSSGDGLDPSIETAALSGNATTGHAENGLAAAQKLTDENAVLSV